MNIAAINGLNRLVEKLKDHHSSLTRDTDDNQQIAMNNILVHINQIENEVQHLKLSRNSLASKVLTWFGNFKEQHPEKGEAFSMQANESSFTLGVHVAVALNVNLVYDPDYRWRAGAAQFAGMQNPQHCERVMHLIHTRVVNPGNCIDPHHFDPLIKQEAPQYSLHQWDLGFKTSKKLFKDEAVFNQVMEELVNKIWDKCLELRQA